MAISGWLHRIRPFLLTVSAALFLPYAATLVFGGGITGIRKEQTVGSGRRVYLDSPEQAIDRMASGTLGGQGYIDAEEYLAGVVLRQIPMDYDLEAIKAQAIVARTWLFRQMNGGKTILASELDAAYPRNGELLDLGDEDRLLEYYEKVRQAVEETAGQVLLYDGQMIEPLFHRASAGWTRSGDAAHPYLKSVESRFDVEAEDYLTVLEWTPEEFAALADTGTAKTGEEDADLIMEALQVVSRDASGYVTEYQIGSHVYTGEEVRDMLSLPSLSFVIESHEGNIRAVCRGQGHALGLSQYGAGHMAAEGQSAEEILHYYYQDITIGSAE